VNRQRLLWLFFSFSGRIDRQAFALAGIFLYLVRLYPVYRMIAAGDEATVNFWAQIFIVLFGILMISHLAIAAKRLHDFGRSGWYSLLFLIGDIIVFLLLCIPQGMKGPNRYGQQTNSPGPGT
jgi:uncharacterized membrane protein YhaH (DUF805 family)